MVLRTKPVLMCYEKNSENSFDIFVDVGHLNKYRKTSPQREFYYQAIKPRFGINVFIFDIKACEFFKKEKK